ncbi:MAG: hypothetical protein QXD62_00885 [Candidatus Woesearchaeota archaeon]
MKDTSIVENYTGNIVCEKESSIFIYGKNDIIFTVKDNVIINILANEDTKIRIEKIYNNAKITINAVNLKTLEVFVYGSENSNIEINILNFADATALPALSVKGKKIAKHSCKIEPLNQTTVFYLKSKGITEKEIKKLIILNRINIDDNTQKIIESLL